MASRTTGRTRQVARPAPAPTRPALKVRYEIRRGELLGAAAGVFADHGYDSTSMAQLANQVGLAAGGIYHYFAGKEQLLVAICDELVDPLLARAREVVAAEQPPSEQLGTLVGLWVFHVVEHRDHMLVFQQKRHAIEHGAQWRGVRRSRKEFERLVEDVLVRAAPHLDRRLALAALLGMVNHTAQWYDPRGRLDSSEIAAGYVELLLGGAAAE